MNREDLYNKISEKGSFLCVGLDTDPSKIPAHLKNEPDPIFAFNKQIIDATLEHCVAYKPNTAFYEALGARGWETLKKTIEYIPEGHFIIADAKRGDIGNTTLKYASAFFEDMGADAVTVNPYMGRDSVDPFLSFSNKWVVLLALTSNPSSSDLELLELKNGKKVFEQLLITSKSWGNTDNTMYVVGATQAESLEGIRHIIPDHFLLVPGVGAQGGSLGDVAKFGMNSMCGLLVNASRAIIYAGNGQDFASKAQQVAADYHDQMKRLIDQYLR
jgi:orotidine-5'-phosphate decarboxylase